MSRAGEVSERFVRSIGGTNNWVTDIRWSNEDGVWSEHSLRLAAGTVTADSTAQARWSCSLTVRGPIVDGSEQPVSIGDDGLNNWHTYLRVDHGIQFGPNDRELIGMGRYRVDTVERATDDPQAVVLTGVSFEAKLMDATFTTPRKLAAGDPYGRVLSLLRQIIPDATLYWDPRVDNDVWLPEVTVEKDRWGQIDGGRMAGSVARALGARIFCDGNGVFVCAPVPSLADVPTWTADAGPGGVLLRSSERLTSEGVGNQIAIFGGGTGGIPPIGPVIVSDSDPYSRTYYKGRFGPRPLDDYTNQNIRSINQAWKSGNGILQPQLGLRQQATFESLHDPLKVPDDVGRLRVPDGLQNVILDSVTYDLLGGDLQTSVRTAVALPAGPADVPEMPESVTV